jgi:DNA polymerase I-like protein with 3'-5' exonuclease and polymerase domains
VIRISLDTETTGVDLHHGAQPFLVTLCNEQWENTWYEWDVDPLTRKVQWLKEDVEEIINTVEEADEVVFQNVKFDIKALTPLLPKGYKWPWHKTRDTLMGGHLLASNHAHDLNSMAVEYLAIDITKYEDRLQKVVAACRNFVKRKHSPIGDWRIAKVGLPEMPSAKEGSNNRKEERVWKFDLWLPRAFAKWVREVDLSLLEPGDLQLYESVTADYANTDSSTTLAIYLRMLEIIEQRKLTPHYEWRLKQLPVYHRIEEQGVTCSRTRLVELETKYRAEAEHAARVCLNIAESYGYELCLPKGSNNNSLKTFVFDVMKLPPVVWTDTGQPSLDKFAIEDYTVSLPARCKELTFIQNLSAKRKRDTALSFIESYKKFWLPLKGDGGLEYCVLYPSINPTGTATLRDSSYNPNEQQISKQEETNLRYIFGPAPGREWWSLDAKNIELRIPAYESGEQELISLFEQPDVPPYYGSTHLLNFHTVYPDIWDVELAALEAIAVETLLRGGKLDPNNPPEWAMARVGPHCKKKFAGTWYQYCKNGGFAVQYGAIEREEGTADKAFHRVGSHARLKERFSALERLNSYWINYASKCGYVETTPDRSVCPDRGYPLLCTRSENGYILPTVPLNYHVQSTAMQWMKSAMIRCQERLDEWERRERFLAWMTMQIHDELVFDFPAGRGSRPWMTNLPRVEQLAALMANGGDDIGVPTPVGIEYHQFNWAEGVTL